MKKANDDQKDEIGRLQKPRPIVEATDYTRALMHLAEQYELLPWHIFRTILTLLCGEGIG